MIFPAALFIVSPFLLALKVTDLQKYIVQELLWSVNLVLCLWPHKHISSFDKDAGRVCLRDGRGMLGAGLVLGTRDTVEQM